jgi:hypothetical protein
VGPDILILEPATHRRLGACAGPRPSGACPLVPLGKVVPCAGLEVAPAGVDGAATYPVSGQMSLCPKTLAEALCVASDAALLVA